MTQTEIFDTLEELLQEEISSIGFLKAGEPVHFMAFLERYDEEIDEYFFKVIQRNGQKNDLVIGIMCQPEFALWVDRQVKTGYYLSVR